MTLDYYTGEVRELIKQVHDDSEIDDRLIIRWINTQRALWIKNQVNNEYVISDNVSQAIRCLPLEIASSKECSFLESTSRFLITQRIPKPIEFKDRLAILDVRVSDLAGYNIEVVPHKDIKYKGNGRYNQQDLFCTYYSNKLYIKIPDNNFKAALLTNVTVDLIAENPMQVASFRGCDNKPCFDVDSDDYPISDALWEYMQAALIKSKFGLMIGIRDNQENNESENS